MVIVLISNISGMMVMVIGMVVDVMLFNLVIMVLLDFIRVLIGMVSG